MANAAWSYGRGGFRKLRKRGLKLRRQGKPFQVVGVAWAKA